MMAIKVNLALQFIFTSAFLLHKTLAVCPPITPTDLRVFQPGESTKVWCPADPNIFYDAVCQVNGIWDHSLRDTQCFGAGVTLPVIPTILPPVIIPAPIIPTVVIPTTQAPLSCGYLEGYMSVQDAGRVFANGAVYPNMRCQNGRGFFRATCTNGAWAYLSTACTGQTPLFPTILPPLITRPNPRYRNCPYNPNTMSPGDAGKVFPHNSRYRFPCGPAYEGKYYDGTCYDGQWYGDQKQCGKNNDLFGNLFQFPEGQFPWWILLLRD